MFPFSLRCGPKVLRLSQLSRYRQLIDKMRLINCKSLDSLCLESFEPCNVPKRYAILSHTWEREAESGSTLEVLFHAFQDSSRRMNDTGTDATGWRKIEGACREAKAFDKSIDYVWVDSCCINKEDAAELQESINSMFKWYAQSTVCLAYLSDAKSDRLDPTSKWFTRGWTLQELVASPKVRFYNHDWQFLGDKFKLSDELAEITGIDTQLLKASDEQSITRRLYQVPVCQKMSWASKRQTTKVEDIAYCLLGIFDINMPLLYGEREAAFQRLQEAIANKYNDLTILAWKSEDTRPESHSAKHVMYYSRTSGLVGSMKKPGSRECYHGIFACSPREFEHSGSIASCFDHAPVFNSEYSIMHKGFRMFGILRKGYPYGSYMMPLMCSASTTTRGRRGRPGVTGESLGIFLKWVGGATYVRASCTEFKSMDPKDLEQTPGQDPFYLAPSVEQLHHSVNSFRRGSISLPQSSEVSISGTEIGIWNTKVSPGSMWDDKERIFYTYGHQSPVGCASYELSGRSGTLFIALFGLHYNGVPWLCLAGPDSSLWPSHVELRRTHLERAAFVARQKCTTRILVDIANRLEYPNQVWLTVEGSLSQQGLTHCVNISLGLEGGPKHSVTGTNNYSDAESSESDESDESEDSDDTVEDWVVVETPSPGTPASPLSPEHPALPVQLSKI